jgi:SAM-dependent methyltransferase
MFPVLALRSFLPFLRRKRPSQAVVLDPEDARFTRRGGRRHLAALPYPLPKDLEEIGRLDFQHYILRTGFQGNYAAPLTNPTAILDVGTGSARWAMEIAANFPTAQVIGVDLVPPAVDERQVLGRGLDRRPDNYAFQVGNALEGLPFSDRSFDFVHMRLLITAIPRDRWTGVVSELARVTRPGGWVELAECGVVRDGGPGASGLWQSWIELCALRGVDFTIGHRVDEMLNAAGLAPVEQRSINFPFGSWGGRLGAASATDCLATAQALRAGVIGAGVRAEAVYDGLVAQAKQEFDTSQRRGPYAYLPFYLAYGQRPLER